MAKKPAPKVGEIRIGRAGNKYNKWTGSRWAPVSAARTAGASGRKASVVSKPRTVSAAKTSTASEGPKRSQPRGSSIASFANNPLGYLTAKSRAASGPALSSTRPAFGTPMRLSKSKKKDAQGRAIYRWVGKR